MDSKTTAKQKAAAALGDCQRITEAAEGRELTNSQFTDWMAAARRYDAASAEAGADRHLVTDGVAALNAADAVRGELAWARSPDPENPPCRPEPRDGYGAVSHGAAYDAGKRAIDSAHCERHLTDEAATKVERFLSAGTAHENGIAARWAATAGAPAYRQAFAALLSDPEHGHMLWTPEQRDAFRAVQEMRAAFDLAGAGYMVPLILDPSVILTGTGTANAMRRVARIVQTTSDAWHGIKSAGVSAEWKTENAQAAEATPTLTDVNIPVYLGDAYCPFSFEVAQDAPDWPVQLQRILIDAADSLMATAYTTGAGTTEPTGIITALIGGASEINGTGSEAIIAADAFSLQNALPARFSPGASFMAHLGIINTLAQLETANGSKVFPEIAQGRLLNRPLVENSDMDGAINPAATANNYCLLYGAFEQYVIADRIGSTLELIQNVVGANLRPTATRGALLYFRTGGNVTDISAFRMLDVPTTA
jgi:HK97 family phage major capsid protein